MSAVAEARKHAHPFKTDANEDELADLRERRQKLIGVEQLAQSAMDDRIAELETAFARKTLVERVELPILDLTPLRWRVAGDRRLKWLSIPRLAAVALEEPEFSIEANFLAGRNSISPELPRAVTACYTDVFTQLRQFRCQR